MEGDRFSQAPISATMGFQVQPGLPGEATIDWEIGPQFHNPMGRIHGGAIAALCDAAMGIAFGRSLDEGQEFSTIELKVSFMRPPRGSSLTATAKVIQRGLRIGFVDCEIRDSKQRLIATASCSCTVLDL